jgi:hypothetical protein
VAASTNLPIPKKEPERGFGLLDWITVGLTGSP